MEIVFQNKREDFEAYYDYMSKTMEEGQQLSRQVYRQRQFLFIESSVMWGALAWGLMSSWKTGFAVFIFFLAMFELILLLQLGFKPHESIGRQLYKNQEKWLQPKALEVFQLARTLKIDDDWLEIRNSEAVHRWRWRQVDRIGMTPNFIFIHVGNCPVVYIPKRDFPSEAGFIDFGKRLAERKEKNRDQAIGAE